MSIGENEIFWSRCCHQLKHTSLVGSREYTLVENSWRTFPWPVVLLFSNDSQMPSIQRRCSLKMMSKLLLAGKRRSTFRDFLLSCRASWGHGIYWSTLLSEITSQLGRCPWAFLPSPMCPTRPKVKVHRRSLHHAPSVQCTDDGKKVRWLIFVTRRSI